MCGLACSALPCVGPLKVCELQQLRGLLHFLGEVLKLAHPVHAKPVVAGGAVVLHIDCIQVLVSSVQFKIQHKSCFAHVLYQPLAFFRVLRLAQELL